MAAFDGAHGASGREKPASRALCGRDAVTLPLLPSENVTRSASFGQARTASESSTCCSADLSPAASMPPPPPHEPEPEWPIPQFHLRIEDLAHPGAKLFLDLIRPDVALREAVITVCNWLYTPDTVPKNVEVVTFVLRPMPGVAHTFGSPTHKEIHFSLDHIRNSESRARDEILGVLTHEMVHCYQYNGLGQAPGGLIEGIADWVRLNAGLGPPHWKREAGDKWDAGYQATAYFLEWIEDRYGRGSIRELNEGMKDKAYDEHIFKDVTGRKISKLWKIYKESLEEKHGL